MRLFYSRFNRGEGPDLNNAEYQSTNSAIIKADPKASMDDNER